MSLALRGVLQLGTGTDLDAVPRRDVDRVAGLRVACGSGVAGLGPAATCGRRLSSAVLDEADSPGVAAEASAVIGLTTTHTAAQLAPADLCVTGLRAAAQQLADLGVLLTSPGMRRTRRL
ncbi:hypothetical protein GCM10009760_63070 [Kitasatospora kazusensis]|uniref:Uncharacterized protein n=1 Tax=Kitasatospora kazusensis TaxID=407974 RepID=A0ABP4KBN9_9ACTN